MSKINVDRFEEIQKQVDNNTEPLDEFVNSLLNDKFKELDNYMHDIDTFLTSETDVPVSTLENMLMNINSMFSCSKFNIEKYYEDREKYLHENQNIEFEF